MEIEDAVHTAILTLKESFEGAINERNIEIGICDQQGNFRYHRFCLSDSHSFLGD